MGPDFIIVAKHDLTHVHSDDITYLMIHIQNKNNNVRGIALVDGTEKQNSRSYMYVCYKHNNNMIDK